MVRVAISPNDRLAQLFHPWSSYVIVPLFALANAGIVLNASFLARAYTSPVTLGILVGYLVGKPVGTAGCAWLVTRLSHGRLRPPVGWGAVAGAGAVAGIGFTVSLLIASLALTGVDLAEAKLGILSAALCATGLTWIVFRAVNRLPTRSRLRALLGTAEVITDLVVPVDEERDHIRGPEKAPVTVVEYGDFECPYCGLAEPAVRELLSDFGDVRYVWRHLPLTDVHPHAQLAAEATEAAGQAGRVLGDARPAARAPGRAHRARPDRVRDLARPGHRAVHRGPAQARRGGARGRGHRFRRPFRRIGNSHVFRQRHAALRRL